jgi:S1-C subfamily serine protease
MKYSFLKIVIISLFFGFFAGIIGYLIFSSYVFYSSPQAVIYKWGEIKKKQAEETEEKISQALKTTLPAVVNIFPLKEKSGELLDQIYLPSESIGYGVILTSDGWILTSNNVINDFRKKYLVSTFNQKTYLAENFKEDKATGAVFFKVNAEGLPVYPFGNSNNLEVGQILITPKESLVNRIENLNYEEILEKSDLIKSSEKFSKYILLTDGPSKAGGPVFNLDGEIVGIFANPGTNISKFKTLIPINNLKNIFPKIFKDGEIKRTFLGVNYIDLSSFVFEGKTELAESGAMLYENKELKIRAVLKNSPAERAGLRAGDIILKIDDEELSQNKDLTEIIQNYQSGETVEFTILRNGKEQTVEARLE